MIQPDESVRAEFREAVEALLRDYVARADFAEMPMVEDWALVATFNDLGDDENGKWLYLRGDKQSTHRTVGLLTMASDDLRGITMSDDE